MDSEVTLAKGVAEGIAVGPTVPSQLTSSGVAEESVGENIITDAINSAVTSLGALKGTFCPVRKRRVASLCRSGRTGRCLAGNLIA